LCNGERTLAGMAKQQIRTAIYTRLSKDTDGDELGVGRQLAGCQALAERLGWQIVATFTDDDISAYSGKTRPGFEALLLAMQDGQLDALIVWHVDRLYRSMKDLERLIEIAEAARVQLRTVNSGDLDLSTSAGRMVARILGSVARQESEHHSERRILANAQRRAAGKFNREGHRIFGYTRDGEPLEPEASALRQAATDVLNGTSLRSIATDWNARGLTTSRGKRWTNLQLRRVLMNPTYSGLVSYDGKVIGTGTWEALWDTDTHHGLKAFLRNKDRRPAVSFERRHVGSGVYRCGKCGALLYAARPHGGRNITYICKAQAHLGRTAAPLDAYVEAIVLGLLQRSDIHRRLTTRVDIDTDGLTAKRKALTAKRDKLATLFTDGVLDEAGVRRESAKLAEQIDGIDQVLAEARRTSPAARLLADGAAHVAEHWANASADIKGKVIDDLMVVTVLPVPKGERGLLGKLGARFINPDFVEITPR
jgi:site-specific DNA recombinase